LFPDSCIDQGESPPSVKKSVKFFLPFSNHHFFSAAKQIAKTDLGLPLTFTFLFFPLKDCSETA
jgi:hypothetical protein